MFLKIILFFLLWNQSKTNPTGNDCLKRGSSNSLQKVSYYIPQCTDLTFGKCSVKSYCAITHNGIHNCLPCSIGKICPGNGYMYSSLSSKQQLSSKYIVSRGIQHNRFLRFKKIGRIVRVGLHP